MSNTVSSSAVTTTPADLAAPRTLSSTAGVFAALLRADLTTQWRNRRASVMVFLLPVIILITWKPLIEKLGGGAALLGNCITLGLNAIGIMGYANSIARDRDKGIFQRLRVSPAPNWTIMVSRLAVQLVMIGIMTLVVFFVGYQYDHVSLSVSGYIASFLAALVCGSVYLALGQAIVGRITNPESVNATSRLIYICFIMIGMFGELGMLGDVIDKAVVYSPYGAVESVVASALVPAKWNSHTTVALLLTLGYTGVFAYLGIKWFKWNSR